MTPLQPVRGTQSLYGGEADRFHRVIKAFDRVRSRYRFRYVEVPAFEFTQVFARSIGETTDIVSKEMYSFLDRGGEQITLRPEFTAGIARSYLSEGWQRFAPLKVATWGPAFRYERPQRGRFRQFHQLDAEVIGASEPAADVELIVFASHVLRKLRIDGFAKLHLNTLGDAQSRERWREALVRYLSSFRTELSEESRARLAVNPLRILDSKDDGDRQIVADAPTIESFLSRDAASFFDEVRRGLDGAGVEYFVDPTLVRGLDYYRHTAFEFVTAHLGAQGTLIGGGRYDGLIEALGGPPTPAVGWAGGIERMAMLLAPAESRAEIMAIVPEREAAEALAQKIAFELRSRDVIVDYLYRGSSRKRLDRYRSRGATTAVFVDVPENQRNIVGTLNIKRYRNMRYSSEERIKRNLAKLFEVIEGYDVYPEGLIDGHRVDFVLRGKVK